MLRYLKTITFGTWYALTGRFYTTAADTAVMNAPTVDEHRLRQIMDAWAAYQNFGHRIGQVLSWSTIVLALTHILQSIA